MSQFTLNMFTPSKANGFFLYIAALLLPVQISAQPLNPDVTQSTINQTICISGYSQSVRPSTSYTNGIKRKMMREQGIDRSVTPYIALDHVIPMALGGHPRSVDNLQLISHKENSRKSRIEAKLLCMVCSGQIALKEAQEAMSNWKKAYHQYAKVRCRR